MGLAELPDDLFLYIFSDLDGVEVCRMECVSKALLIFRTSTSESLWAAICLREEQAHPEVTAYSLAMRTGTCREHFRRLALLKRDESSGTTCSSVDWLSSRPPFVDWLLPSQIAVARSSLQCVLVVRQEHRVILVARTSLLPPADRDDSESSDPREDDDVESPDAWTCLARRRSVSRLGV